MGEGAIGFDAAGPRDGRRPPPREPGRAPVRAFARFLAVGCLGLAVDLAVFSLLDAHGTGPAAARLASLAAALGVTWGLNRRYTFARSGRDPAAELLRYGINAFAAQGTGYGIFLMLVHRAPDLPRGASLLGGAAVAAFLGFALHRLFAFSPVATPSRPA